MPQFLMCPVEYSSNRANPSVTKSEYLGTLGSKLHPDIGIFWTGGKVVSETICKEELIVVRKVLRRKPVIWDNLGRSDSNFDAFSYLRIIEEEKYLPSHNCATNVQLHLHPVS